MSMWVKVQLVRTRKFGDAGEELERDRRSLFSKACVAELSRNGKLKSFLQELQPI
jgi:hypothetical protein